MLSQIFGFGAISAGLIVYMQTRRKHIIALKMVQDSMWLIHYVLEAGYTAAAISALAIVRGYVFGHNDKKCFSGKRWLYIFLALIGVTTVLTWQNIYSIFPAITSVFSAVAFWMKDTRHTKMLMIVSSSFMIYYNMNMGHSLSVYVGHGIIIGTSIVSLMLPHIHHVLKGRHHLHLHH